MFVVVWQRVFQAVVCVLSAVWCGVQHTTPHGTQYTHHSLKYSLPQRHKSYNYVLLLINSTHTHTHTKVALARLSISSLRMVQVDQNV